MTYETQPRAEHIAFEEKDIVLISRIRRRDASTAYIFRGISNNPYSCERLYNLIRKSLPVCDETFATEFFIATEDGKRHLCGILNQSQFKLSENVDVADLRKRIDEYRNSYGCSPITNQNVRSAGSIPVVVTVGAVSENASILGGRIRPGTKRRTTRRILVS